MEIKVVKQPHQGVIYPGLAMTAFSSAPPAPPPFWSMNSTPGGSKARRIRVVALGTADDGGNYLVCFAR